MKKSVRNTLLFASVISTCGLLYLNPYHAEATDLGAIISYPSYKKTEQITYTCTSKESDMCNSIQSYYTEIKKEYSPRGNFIKKEIIGQIPGAGFLQRTPLEKSSTKKVTLYKQWWKKAYGIHSCTEEHTFLSAIRSLVKVVQGDIFVEENKERKSCTGPKGTDSGWKEAEDEPDIEMRPYKGTGETITQTPGMSTKFSVVENSAALLTLTVPEARKIIPSTMKEVCKTLPGDLIKGCIEGGVGAISPDGGIITGRITAKITEKGEDILFKTNPVWVVPLSVKAYELLPFSGYSMFEVEEKQVTCASIRVGNKSLDANCRVLIPLSKKEPSKNVTPDIPGVKYFRYEIEIAGNAQKQVQKPARSLLASLSDMGIPSARAEGAGLRFDDDGFLIVPWWNSEDLKVEEEDAETQTSPLEVLRARLNSLLQQMQSIRARIEELKWSR
ncbi:MAG: hypothetical protein FJY98_01050 [Candidatus Liptonbacteria bacterium]|nr:hypothetical protein [Candidatus Liptonbacteria bacterium]